MSRVDFFGTKIFYELDDLARDSELIDAAKTCIEAHQTAEIDELKVQFRPDPDAIGKISEEALDSILRSGKNVHGIAKEREITNCLIINVNGVKDSLAIESLRSVRGKLDKVVFRKVNALFGLGERLDISNSGHFLYPPGGFMSWHTNSGYPGWRLYINFAEEPGKSFFRYRDPETGEIVTSIDKQWNFRLFKIDPAIPFWHAVYSETNRYSFGFRITLAPKENLTARMIRKFKKLTVLASERS